MTVPSFAIYSVRRPLRQQPSQGSSIQTRRCRILCASTPTTTSLPTRKAIPLGAHVIHPDYGVGRFRGTRRSVPTDRDLADSVVDQNSSSTKCAVVEFRDGCLDIPVADALVMLSVVPPGLERELGSLRSQAKWKRTVDRAREGARRAAMEMVWLYHARNHGVRRRLYERSPLGWEQFEAAFDYEPTADQDAAFRDIERDMCERDRPMDRILVGDVGFGKTEVALRAAARCVLSGRQVAFLCPTTVLAGQHMQTISSRLVPHLNHSDSSVAILTRFTVDADRRRALDGLKQGSVQLVVGTHLLLSNDVEFADLGLAIIDEEHRFGVTAKEALKNIQNSVDVLTISATPIPRTLYIGTSGLRPMSTLAEPPKGRLPVHTISVEVGSPPSDSEAGQDVTMLKGEDVIKGAIDRELQRGGQVFYVAPRIRDLLALRRRVQRLCPEARLLLAHGQMTNLEDIMYAVGQGKADVLVSTNIVESGLDIPRMNTIIIDQAGKFGLAQLHQLRGRVGRSVLQGYAYICVREGVALSETAHRRLQALERLGDLGSGFELAQSDMELRGSGNTFGKEQSGRMTEIGATLYMQLLRDAVADFEIARTIPFCTSPSVEISHILDKNVSFGKLEDVVEDMDHEKTRVEAIGDVGGLNNISSEWRAKLAARYQEHHLPTAAAVLLLHRRTAIAVGSVGVTRCSRTRNRLHLSLYTTLSAKALGRCLETVFERGIRENWISPNDVSGIRFFWHQRCVLRDGVGIVVRGMGSQPITWQYRELIRHFEPLAKAAECLRNDADKAYGVKF